MKPHLVNACTAGLLFTLLLAIGCKSPPHPEVRWELMVTDRSGVYLMETSPRSLFGLVPTYRLTKIKGLKSKVAAQGVSDPQSGRLAVMEQVGERESSIRVYDNSRNLLGEHQLHASIWSAIDMPLWLSPGGEWLLYGEQVLPATGSDPVTLEAGSFNRSAHHAREAASIDWMGIGAGEIVHGYSIRDVYHYDLRTGKSNRISEERYQGVVEGKVAAGEWPIQLIDLDGKPIRDLGNSWVRTHEYSGYKFSRISPDGRYLMYDHPVAGGILGHVTAVQDLVAKREVWLTIYPYCIGSWHAFPKPSKKAIWK